MRRKPRRHGGPDFVLSVVVALLASAAGRDARPQDPPPAETQPPAATAEPAPAPAAGAPDQQAEKTTSLSAEVIEVSGSVDRALPGVSPLESDGWIVVTVGDRLDSRTQVRTGLRSHVNLRFGETTIVSVRSATHASIDQFYRSATAEHVRVDLGYGTVRGGSSRGRYRSDVIVNSTVATLAKRGTEGWEMWVEPMTGRFRIALAEEGLVEAIQRLSADRQVSRTVRPGEYATEDNIANLWINQAAFDRLVQFYKTEWVTSSDAEFALEQDRGFAVLGPAGAGVVDLSQRTSARFVLDQTAARMPDMPRLDTVILRPLRRPEGNFGTGPVFRVLAPRTAARLTGRSGDGLRRFGK